MVEPLVSDRVSAFESESQDAAPMRPHRRLRLAFGAAFTLASIITALAVFLTTAAPASRFLAADVARASEGESEAA